MINLDEIEARAKAATPGPWRSFRDGNQYIGKRLVGASRIPELSRPWNPGSVTPALSLEDVVRLTDYDSDFIATINPALILEWVKETRLLQEHFDHCRSDVGPPTHTARLACIEEIRTVPK